MRVLVQVQESSRVITLKLVAVLVGVLEAASLANDWILIDRSPSSPTADLLLELAVKELSPEGQMP